MGDIGLLATKVKVSGETLEGYHVFVGGGLYMPAPEDLNAVREHIAANTKEFREIVEARSFRRIFGELSGEQLQRVPRGFRADHPAAPYLKFKQFLAGRSADPALATKPAFFEFVVESLEAMTPFIRFLNGPILKTRRSRRRQESMLSRP